MIITITTRNPQAEIQTFVCQLDRLETLLDVVSLIAGQGNQLLEALLIDQGTTTPLPLEVFDGQSFSEPIQQLERQWQRVLGEQSNHEIIGDQGVVNLIDRRIKRHRALIPQLRRAISFTQQQLQRIQNAHFQERYYGPTLRQLQRTLELHQHSLAREHESLQRLLSRR